MSITTPLDQIQAVPAIHNSQDFVAGYLGGKVAVLRALLGQIDFERENRTRVGGRLERSLQHFYDAVKDELLPLQQQVFLWDRSWDRRRSELEQRLLTVGTERVRVHQETARELARLARERRTWWKQYCDLVQRLSVFDGSGGSGWKG